MRDIRDDLQERANVLAEQMSATQNQFDKYIEQLKLEHQGKLKDLKSDLNSIRLVMKTEDRLLGIVIPPNKLQSEPKPPQQPRPQQTQSQQPTSDSLMRKVSALAR
jgi:malate synthase